MTDSGQSEARPEEAAGSVARRNPSVGLGTTEDRVHYPPTFLINVQRVRNGYTVSLPNNHIYVFNDARETEMMTFVVERLTDWMSEYPTP